jgi:hypothetical protein
MQKVQVLLVCLLACPLLVQGARIKKKVSTSSAFTTDRSKEGCQQANAFLESHDVELGDPEFTWQSTFHYTVVCAYTIPKETRMLRPYDSTYNKPGIQLHCKKSGRTSMTCTATTFGTKHEMPGCEEMPEMISLGSVPNVLGVISDECKIHGFIERFTPLHFYSRMEHDIESRVNELRKLPPGVQSKEAKLALNGFFWAVRRSTSEIAEMIETAETFKKSEIAEWFDRVEKKAPPDAIKDYVVDEMHKTLQAAPLGERRAKLLEARNQLLSAHVGPTPPSKRMTEELCEHAMRKLPCPSFKFEQGAPVSTWDHMTAQNDDDQCSCVRTFDL